MNTIPFPESVKKILVALPSPRSRIAFVLALQTGLKYSTLLKLQYEDLYLPNGVVSEVLLSKPRRATKRHPYCRYGLTPWVRTAVHTYCVAHTVTRPGAFLFAARPQRNVPVTARHLLREIKTGLQALDPETNFEPKCVQAFYRAQMLTFLEGDKYLWRVACGLRLPKDGPEWKTVQELKIFAAQARVVEKLCSFEFWMFWQRDGGPDKRAKECK